MTLCTGCASVERERLVYQKQYRAEGVPHTPFRGRWWNYYEWGKWFIHMGKYEEAERDLRIALSLRDKDQYWARTYGMHITQEYFPNRELGVALYFQNQFEESQALLQKSVGQQISSRGGFYLTELRTQQVESAQSDQHAPTFELISPDRTETLADSTVLLEGIARDDTFVKAVSINGQKIDVQLAQAELSIQKGVELAEGEKALHVVVTDITGKTTESTIPLTLDKVGPQVYFESPLVAPGVARGVVLDASGVRELTIDGQPVALTPLGHNKFSFSHSVDRVDLQNAPGFHALDNLGNPTSAPLPIHAVAIEQAQLGFQLARHLDWPLSPLEMLPLADGRMLIAEKVQKGSLTIELKDLEPEQVVYQKDFAFTVEVNPTASPVQTISLLLEKPDGSTIVPEAIPLDTTAGPLISVVTYSVLLEEGVNKISATARNSAGEEVSAQSVLTYERPFKTGDHKLSVTVFKPRDGEGEGFALPEGEGMPEGEGETLLPWSHAFSYVTAALGGSAELSERFDIVDRSLLQEILLEQQMSAISNKVYALQQGEARPAEMILNVSVFTDANSIEITLTGEATAPAMQGRELLPLLDVTEPLHIPADTDMTKVSDVVRSHLDEAIDNAARRLISAFPAVDTELAAFDGELASIDLWRKHGLRENLLCMIYKLPDVAPGKKRTAGNITPVYVGYISEVTQDPETVYSSAKMGLIEGAEPIPTGLPEYSPQYRFCLK